VSIKQWVEPQSTKPVVGSSEAEAEGIAEVRADTEVRAEAEVREMEMIRESGSDKAAALSWTFGRSLLELLQPSGGGGGGLLTLLTPQRE